MVYRRNARWLFSLLALIIALPILLPANALSAWNDVTASVALNRTRPLYNYVAKTNYFDGSLTNTSGESFQAPIRLVIDSVTSPLVTVHNADGTTDDGKPYFDFSGHLSDEKLGPSETSSARQLEFYNPNRLRFNFTVKVFVEAQAEVVLESLSVSPASTALTGIGASQQLTVTGSYSNGTTRDLTPGSTGTTYESSDVGVALVGPDGLVAVGTSSGTAVVTATNSGNSASCQVEVSIDVTPPVVTITAPTNGTTATSPQITVIGTIEDESPIQSAFINGAPLSLDGINFSVQVDLVAGANPIEVTATDAYGNVGSASISVTYIALESLSISPASVTLTSAGETQQLTVTGTYSDTSTKDLTAAGTGTVYTSNNHGAATVSPDGLVTAGTANGTAAIMATYAGISASAQVEVYIDVNLPVVTITAPATGATLTSPQVTVLGTIEDESPIQSALINGAPLTLDGINFSAQLDLVEGVNPVTVTATDAYGNVGSAGISVTYIIEAEDTIPPLVTITAPKDGVQLTQTPVHVTGTVQDASHIKSLTVNGQPATLTDTFFALDLGLAEGTNTITATATDEHDNIGSDSITVILDTTPPLLTIESVPPLTNKTQLPVRGTSEPGAALALTGGVNPVSGPTDQVSGGFSLPVDLHQNAHNTLSVTASDSLGNMCLPKTLDIKQDSTPPNVVSVTPGDGETVLSQNVPCSVTFSEPVTAETVALGTSFQLTCEGAAVNGSLTLSQDNQVATFMPEGAFPLGSQVDLLITSAIKDFAGNQMAAPFTSHFFTPQEIGASVVTGEVYDDTQGLLLSGAMAKLLSTNGVPLGENAPSMVTGADGLFTLEVSPGMHTILIVMEGYTSVERKIEVSANASATLLDARLTPLDVRVNRINGLAGGTATNAQGDITAVFPEDVSSSDIELLITEVSQQGLKSPLPLGWSPAVSVDLAANVDDLRNPATLVLPMPSGISDIVSLTPVRWDGDSCAWRALIEPCKTGEGSKVELSIHQLGQFSLVKADQWATAPPVATPGDILQGAATVAYPAGIAGEGLVVPALIMAGEDAHARASATLTLPDALPSGAVFEAQVKESFSLISSEEVVSRPFVQDLHFYAWPDDGNPLTLCVEFPVTPSKQYALGELFLGKVDLFIREPQSAATHMVGPAGGDITTDEGLDVSIPSGCLDRNTTLNAQTVPESLFGAPVPSGQTFLGGFSIDFGGVSILGPVQVALPILDSMALLPEPVIVMARVEEFEGIPGLFLVGLGQMAGDLVQSLNESSDLTFSGIDRAGQYGFFLISEPIGFLQGTVTAVSDQPSTNAVISHDLLPFLAKVDENGRYIQVGHVDELELIAKNPVTNDQGTTAATITSPNEVVNSNIAIQQIPPEVVSVSPVNGVTNVPVTTSVTVTFSEPVTGLNTDTFELKDPAGNTVAGQLSITVEAKTATFYPDASLASESLYTLHLNTGIQDKAGYALSGFTPTNFTTVDLTPPVFEGELSVSMPDENGYAMVTGTPGTAEPNSVVYIINNTSGMVVTISIPSSTDGSFNEQILADISDEIIVTIVDASGNSTTLNPGPFVDETTGAVVVGPEGGTVRGEGGIELDIPAGALPYATVVTIEPVTKPFELPADILADPEAVAAFEESYDFVTAVRIDTGGVDFNYGVDLSVPAPAGYTPDTTFVAVMDREIEVGGEYYDVELDELTEQESNVVGRFHVADVATIKEMDGEMRLSTASPPFPGILSSGILNFFAPRTVIVVVSGNVVRKVTDIGGNVNTYPVEGAIVRLFGSETVPVYFAESDEDGMFVISAIQTMGLTDLREITLLATDPLSAIIQKRTIPISFQSGPFAATHPEWNIGVAAMLKEDFVLVSEERIREDKTPPSIDIRFSAATLVDNIMDEGNDLTIDINVSDIRDPNPVIENIVMNGELTFIGEPDTHQHVIANIQGGLYYIEVTAYDNAMPSNSRSLQKTILVRTPGGSPGSVEGPPSFISYSVDYIGEDETVDINTNISITFNEPIDRATVDDTTFVVRDVTTGEIITGQLVFTDYDSTITFIPDQRLKYGHEYEVEIAVGITGLRDTEGNPVVFVAPIAFKTNSPQVINSYPILGAKDLAVKGTTAYVTDSDRGEDKIGLTIIDFPEPWVSDVKKRVPLRSDSYSSYAVAVSGEYAYVITVGGVIPDTYTLLSTLQKWDISDPKVPVKVSWTPLTTVTSLSGTIPVRLVVSEGFVFVAMLNSGFKIFDASDLTPLQNAEFVNRSAGNSQAADIAVLGEYAYIANGPTGELVVVKFTNPDGNVSQFYTDALGDIKPGYSIAGRATIFGSVNAYRVKVIGNFRVKDGNGYVYRNLAFVACLEKGMAIVDITDPANPEHLYTLSIPGRVIGLDIDKEAGIAVLSASSGGLRIVNFQDFDLQDRASTIYELGYVDLGSPTKGGGIIVSNGIAYVTMENDVQLVRIKRPSLIDVDVDSNNDNEFNMPDRSDEEEQIENIGGDSSKPGKIFFINNGDSDNDMIPDFADFDIASMPGNEVYFTPIVVGLSETVDLNKVLIKFAYSESDPNQMAPPTGSGTPDDPYVYDEPASGHLRIWTKNGVVMRNKNEVGSSGGGDFVKSGIIYSAAQLGFISGPASTHLVVFFMEGIRTPVNIDDSRVKVEIDPNGVEGGIDFISRDIVMLAMSDLNITVDSNNDGNVDKEDEVREDYESFVFWFNDDDNSNEDAIKHKASISSIDRWNGSDVRINGMFDLIDLAPLKIHVDEKIRKSLKLLNYRLLIHSEGVRYFASSRSNTHNGKLIPDKVHDYETQDSYLTLKSLAEDQVLQQSLGGVDGDVEIVWDRFDADGNLWLLFEGVGTYSETTVSLILEGPNSNHQFVTDAVKVRLKRSEDFFKTYSVRDSQNNDVEYITERLKNKSEEPDPRKTTIDRYGPAVQLSGSINGTNNLLIFVHGYNVTADFANVFYQSAFKRLYRMGYRDDMIAYKWEGDQTLLFDPNVKNAFESSQSLMDLILEQKSLGKTINIVAHSLGNLVVLDALRLLTYHDPDPNVGSINNLIHIEAAVWDSVYDERPGDYINRAIEQKLMWNHWCSDVPSIVTGNIVNSYNREDFALKWMIRNDLIMILLGDRYDISEIINLGLFSWRTPNALAYNIPGAFNLLDLQTHPIGNDNINVALNFNANRYGWKIRQHSGFRENYYYEVYKWWKDIVFRYVN